ncbi:hypothetical protein RCL1_004609 [Eukaryota sp. TZLM3-RCL]
MFSPLRRTAPNDFQQPQVSRSSDEFHYVQYRLSVVLRSFSANILKVYNVSNPQLTSRFEKRTEGKLVLDSWVDTSLLSDDNSVNDILHRGFSVPPHGTRFTTGGVALPHSSGVRRYELLLCKVGVGRSFVVRDASLRPVPPGYDSLAFPSSSVDLSSSHSLESWRELPSRQDDLYSDRMCDYLIAETEQVLPSYLVLFEFDPSNIGKTPDLVCDVCEQRNAVVYCHQDEAKLCSSCDQHVHSANKIVSRHHRVPVSEQPQGFGTCSKHEDMQLEFFCPICFLPICVHCKMIGSHASGECASHKLIPISEAYKKAVDTCKGSDLPLLDTRKHGIRTGLRQLEERRKEIDVNARSVEEAIYTAMQQALDSLKTLVETKNNVILSEALELRRQLIELESSELFIRNAQSYLPPTEFLKAFSHHKSIRDELTRMPALRAEIDVFPDLQLAGAINITSSESGVNNQSNVSSSGLFPNPSSTLRAQLLKNSKLGSQFGATPFQPPLNTPFQPTQPLAQPSFSSSNSSISNSFAGLGPVEPLKFHDNSSPSFTPHSLQSSPLINEQSLIKPGSSTGSTVVKAAKPTDIWRQHLSRARGDGLPNPTLQPPLPPSEDPPSPPLTLAQPSDPTPSTPLDSSFSLPLKISLTTEAQKKIQDLKSAGFKLTPHVPFADSQVIPSDLAKVLYYNLPFSDQPNTKLLFSTATHHRSITTLHALCDSNGPTIVVLKCGEFIFGGYAGSPWNVNQTRFGTPKCFLFSLNKDAKIPYHGKEKSSRCLWASPSCIAFGTTDLLLENDFNQCSSLIEGSYGFGLQQGTEECGTFLAGSRVFVPEIVEVWGFDKL